MPTLMNNARIKDVRLFERNSDNYVMTVPKHKVSAVETVANSLGLQVEVSDLHQNDVLIYTDGPTNAKSIKQHFNKLYG